MKTASEWVEVAEGLGPLIREHADSADRHARLDDEVVEALHTTGLYRTMVPVEMGGSGLSIPDALPVVEALARADAAVGWTFAICGFAPYLAMRLDKEAFHTIYSDPRATLSGSLAPAAKAVPAEGGYHFSGVATFASGAWNATWLQLSALVFEGERPRMVNGAPEMIAGVMPIGEVQRMDTWNPVGMRGTGSIDCRVDNVFVPEGFTYGGLLSEKRWECGPAGNIPITQQVNSPLAAVAVGTARGAIDAFVEIVKSKMPIGSQEPMANNAVIASAVAEATGLVDAADATLLAGAEAAWERGCSGEPWDAAALAHGRMASVTAARLSREAVSLLRMHAGTGTTNLSNRFGRAWRDVDTVLGHIILSPPRMETAGRALMGLPPNALFI
jgi:alkylation response protein AidB-like acyl-CoA dehydrogenase